MDYRRALPFYHAYSQYGDLGQMDADAVAGDLEYLQQMYPSYAKKYHRQYHDHNKAGRGEAESGTGRR